MANRCDNCDTLNRISWSESQAPDTTFGIFWVAGLLRESLSVANNKFLNLLQLLAPSLVMNKHDTKPEEAQ